jgi:hypothetical protein
MFETVTTDSGAVIVRVSFWQCMKAGLAFTLGASLWLPAVLLMAAMLGGSWLTLLGLLGSHRR